MAKQDIAAIWHDIERWLARHAPDRKAELNDGADDAALAALAKLVGHDLPADYAASLRLHNGTANLTSYIYNDTVSVAARWEARKPLENDKRTIHDPDAGIIKPRWWSPAWLPFAEDSEGNLLCLDLDPAPKGKVGQVLIWEMSMGPGLAGFGSFGDWLADYRDGLKGGRFVVDDSGYIYEK